MSCLSPLISESLALCAHGAALGAGMGSSHGLYVWLVATGGRFCILCPRFEIFCIDILNECMGLGGTTTRAHLGARERTVGAAGKRMGGTGREGLVVILHSLVPIHVHTRVFVCSVMVCWRICAEVFGTWSRRSSQFGDWLGDCCWLL